jgi:hypothetical protein
MNPTYYKFSKMATVLQKNNQNFDVYILKNKERRKKKEREKEGKCSHTLNICTHASYAILLLLRPCYGPTLVRCTRSAGAEHTEAPTNRLGQCTHVNAEWFVSVIPYPQSQSLYNKKC